MCTDSICSIFFTNTWCCQSFSFYPYGRSLITNDAEHFPCVFWPLVCLLIWSVCLSFLTMFVEFFFSWLICETSLQIPNISLLSDIGIGIIFPSLWLAFFYSLRYVLEAKGSYADELQFIIPMAIIDSAFLCLKKSWSTPKITKIFS